MLAGKRKNFIWVALALLTVMPLCAPGYALSSSTHPGQHFSSLQDGFRYGLPPQVERSGLVIAKAHVPIHRKDVRERILKELNYLLQDRRSRVLLWLAKSDSLRPVIAPILRKYDVPDEFIYLAAIESSYNSRSLSSAGAYGYWQFIKSTALCGPQGCDQYDWRMSINNWKDERADLVHSTHSAARYLAWLNRVKKISLNGQPEREGFNDWLLTAAAYNAGPTRVTERLNAYRASSYWDVSLPVETERYVPRWIAVWLISKHRDFYGVRPPSHETMAFDTLEKVKLQKDLSFSTMAGLIESTPRVIWSLNTQIPPEKALFPARSGRKPIEHTIHVPKGKGRQLLAQLAAHGYTKK
jgi:membrane-bound lytic murein transglycosylase D